MAMHIGPVGDQDTELSQINTTPLVDVMLVLLIIFLITIPVVTTSVAVKLPLQRVEDRQSKPENIILSVNQQGQVFWFDAPVPDAKFLFEKLRQVSSMSPQPEIQIRGDMAARYEGVGRILYACQRAGIAKVSFITEPPALGI